MRTILLLLASNLFMTFAWYGHLRNHNQALWKAVLISWGIAFLLLPEALYLAFRK